MQCQESGYANCEANYTGGCQTQCSLPTGALYCNINGTGWQYINVNTTNLQACLTELSSTLNINIDASAAGSCNGGSCSGTASASCGQIAPGAVPPLTESVLGLGIGLGIAGAIRRRTRRSK